MSMATSGNDVFTHTPKVLCIFLVQFDMKLGYKLVWSSLQDTQLLAGIESKALPSGIHEFSSTTVYLTHELNGQLHYGFARFRQLDLNARDAPVVDRLLVKMYALGILVEPLRGKFWQPLQYLSLGWEHTKAVDLALVEYLRKEELSVLTDLNNTLTSGSLSVPNSNLSSFENHPLSKLPAVMSLVGPLIFPLYKAAILRKRILVISSPSQGHSELFSEHNSVRDPATAGALAYLISLLSVVPKDVHLELPKDSSALQTSRPIYSIGLSDLSSNFFVKFPGYIATTGDEIIKDQRNVYDIALTISSQNDDSCQLTNSEDPSEALKSTYNDYSKFLKLYQKLPQNVLTTSNSAVDDTASIKTASSMLSALGLGYFVDGKDSKLLWEPKWWLSDATSPMSWREYVWLAFAWFASAGATNREAETIDLDDGNGVAEEDVRNLVERLTSIVGQFHRLTKKWFYVIDEIVSEMVDYVQSGNQEKFVLELTLQDLVDMELDPYSLQDLAFIREFALTYWGSIIKEVEIGMGFTGICC